MVRKYHQSGMKKKLANHSAATRSRLEVQRKTSMPHEWWNVFVSLLCILFQLLEKLHVHSALRYLSYSSTILLVLRYLVYQRPDKRLVIS